MGSPTTSIATATRTRTEHPIATVPARPPGLRAVMSASSQASVVCRKHDPRRLLVASDPSCPLSTRRRAVALCVALDPAGGSHVPHPRADRAGSSTGAVAAERRCGAIGAAAPLKGDERPRDPGTSTSRRRSGTSLLEVSPSSSTESRASSQVVVQPSCRRTRSIQSEFSARPRSWSRTSQFVSTFPACPEELPPLVGRSAVEPVGRRRGHRRSRALAIPNHAYGPPSRSGNRAVSKIVGPASNTGSMGMVANMTAHAVFITHHTKSGQRAEAERVWNRS